MEEKSHVIEMAKAFGFDYAAPVKYGTVMPMQEVRQMCAANTCRKYDKNWSCPPACGSLEECRREIERCAEGILVQTVGKLEDSMDVEGMLEAEKRHKARFLKMQEAMTEKCLGLLALGTGCCTICDSCTYPISVCRFPGKRISSLEAYGILVSDLCSRNHLRYYYGPDTIAYTACFLWEKSFFC